MDKIEQLVVCSDCHGKVNVSMTVDGKIGLECNNCKVKCCYQIEQDAPVHSSHLLHSNPVGYDGDSSSIHDLSLSLNKLVLEKPSGPKMRTGLKDKGNTKGVFREDNNEVFGGRTLRNMKLSPEVIEKLEKLYVIAQSMSREEALKKIREKLLLCDFENEIFNLTMSGCGANTYVYDETLRQLCRTRKPDNKIRHVKASRMAQVLRVSENLLVNNRTERLRLLHYMHPQLHTHEKSETSMENLRQTVGECTVMLAMTRESMMLSAFPQGLIVGTVVLYAGNKELVNCNLGGTTGNLIPSESEMITRIIPTDTVRYVLVVEKETIFHHLAAKDFHNTHHCILVTGRGVPDVYTRILLRKFKDHLGGIPMYGLVDGNPTGARIFSTYCFGSDEKAHENLYLTVPDMQYIGVFIKDIDEENRSPFSVNDQSVADSLLKKVYIQKLEVFRENLVLMDKEKCKADIEMLMKQQDLEQFITGYVDKAEKAADSRN